MADSIEPNWLTRVRLTPLRDLLRGDVSGRNDRRNAIATAGFPAPVANLLKRIGPTVA